MSVEFTKGHRGSVTVIFNGFRYCKDKKYNSCTYMKCVKHRSDKCSGRLVLDAANNVSKYTEHTCTKDPAELNVHLTKQKVKNMAVSSTHSTKRVVAESIRGLDEESLIKLPL